MLITESIANPQPRRSTGCQGTPHLSGTPATGPASAVLNSESQASSMIAGTGPAACAGVTSSSPMFDLNLGIDRVVHAAHNVSRDHVHAIGVRRRGLHHRPRHLGQVSPASPPKISRSNSATISGRRLVHHTAAVVTRWPSFNTSGFGSVGYTSALASS